VRRLRLSRSCLLVVDRSDSNAIPVVASRTVRDDSMCYHDLVRNGCHRPVLKHGPRSLTSMRVFE
jgi:hypothetical protein